MSMQTWGVRIYGVELTTDRMKEEYRGSMEERDTSLLEVDFARNGVFLPDLMSLDIDVDGRIYLGYYPVFPWVPAKQSDIPHSEEEAREKIKDVLAKILKDPNDIKDENFSDIESYNCG